ncbi:MAG: glycine cleavage system aminomethyltransferase GcvT [Endomicrobiales bacterium]|nr:glycine cleavage system aminomethyltransferase GcvT [Endomicrobiales bacterium]
MLHKTSLHQKHLDLGAKMVDFAGWDMPLYYSSMLDEHNTVRKSAGVFDASHMGEFLLKGEGSVESLEKLVTSKVSTIPIGKAKYGLLLNDSGGTTDDLIIYRLSQDSFIIIINSSNKATDFNWIQSHLWQSTLEDLSGALSLLALQGPNAQNILQTLLKSDLSQIPYFGFIKPEFIKKLSGFALIARTGYTGEDGFEIIIDNTYAADLFDQLIINGAKPCGLGARDTLRLEAGMPLYGNELDDKTTPLDAGLSWAVSFDKDFIGKDALLLQTKNGLNKYLKGIVLDSGIPRHNCDIIFGSKSVGKVASGTFSPTLKKGIATAFLNFNAQDGERVGVVVHGQNRPATIVKMPFYKRVK